jgi:hypothetical protein
VAPRKASQFTMPRGLGRAAFLPLSRLAIPKMIYIHIDIPVAVSTTIGFSNKARRKRRVAPAALNAFYDPFLFLPCSLQVILMKSSATKYCVVAMDHQVLYYDRGGIRPNVSNRESQAGAVTIAITSRETNEGTRSAN